MDIVLGVSQTPNTVRLVLVEGIQGDGAIIDHDTIAVSPNDGSATSTNSVAQVVAAVLGTQESAREGGHELRSIGITWSDRTEAIALRDALAAHGIKDAMLVSELHAAGALAQTAGRAVGYESTALLFLDRDTATLSVVRTDDGSIVKVLSRDLHDSDAMAVLADMASAVAAQDSPPQGMFVVGSGVDVASVKSHLQDLVSLPVNAPEESGLALARGAALAAASAPEFDASTVGLAYSQDFDGDTSGNDYPGLADASTEMRPVGLTGEVAEEGRKPFLLVGSALTAIFVVGVVALVISLAVSIRPTADQRPDAGQSAIIPSAPVAAPPIDPVPEAAPAPAPPPAAAPAPAPETIPAPVPVVQQQPQAAPRTVYVEQPAAPAPVPEAAPAPAPAPAAPVIPDVPVVAPQVPPVYQPSWQQWPQQQWPRQQYPQYPQQQYPQYPQQQYPQYPQQQYPQYPQQQQPQWPWPSQGNGGGGNRGDDGGYGGGGYGNGNGGGDSRGNGGGGNGSGACFLIFCAPGGGHR